MKSLLTAMAAAFTMSALLFTSSPAQAQSEESTLKTVLDRGKIIVGIPVDSPPFGYVDENGDPVGFDIDLARLMAEQLGVELEMKQMTTANRIPFLLTNKVDVQVNIFGATPQRAKQIAFTSPYSGLTIGVYGPPDVDIGSAEALEQSDYSVAVGRGTTMDLTLEEVAPEADVVRYEDEATTHQAVMTGQNDLWAAVNVQVVESNKRNPNNKMELKFQMRLAPASIGLRQGDPVWRQWLNTFVYFNKVNGNLQKLHQKWLNEDLKENLVSF